MHSFLALQVGSLPLLSLFVKILLRFRKNFFFLLLCCFVRVSTLTTAHMEKES